jgi:hypothetical protein
MSGFTVLPMVQTTVPAGMTLPSSIRTPASVMACARACRRTSRPRFCRRSRAYSPRDSGNSGKSRVWLWSNTTRRSSRRNEG